MSDYIGLYVTRLENGEIYGVQVETNGGFSTSLTPEDYIRREIKPSIDKLPDSNDFISQQPQT